MNFVAADMRFETHPMKCASSVPHSPWAATLNLASVLRWQKTGSIGVAGQVVVSPVKRPER